MCYKKKNPFEYSVMSAAKKSLATLSLLLCFNQITGAELAPVGGAGTAPEPLEGRGTLQIEIKNSKFGMHIDWHMHYPDELIDFLEDSPSIPSKPILSGKNKCAFSTVPVYVRYKKSGEEFTKLHGTSFIVSKEGENLLITNPHVVQDPPHETKDKAPLTDHQFEIHLHAMDKKEMNKDDRLKIMVFREKASDFQKRFFYRKGSPQLELAVLNLSQLTRFAKTSHPSIEPIFNAVSVSSFASIKDAGYLEEITMFGYPKGLINESFNLPLARTGKTSTYARVRHPDQCLFKDSKKETPYHVDFLIDAACLPGSSGSPVWLVKEVDIRVVTDIEVKGTVSFRKESFGSGGSEYVASVDESVDIDFDPDHESITAKSSRNFKLLGVLFGGPLGGLSSEKAAKSGYPFNLGWVIHTQTLSTFLDDYVAGRLEKSLVGFKPSKKS